MSKRFLLLGLTIIVVAAVGTLTWNIGFEARGKKDYDTILGLTLFVISIVTFFGFLIIGQSGGAGPQLTKGGLRTAIAAAFVVTYLFLVSFEIYLVPPEQVSPITLSFIQSFTSIVGITIAFYFGASAAIQIFGKGDSKEKASAPKKEDER